MKKLSSCQLGNKRVKACGFIFALLSATLWVSVSPCAWAADAAPTPTPSALENQAKDAELRARIAVAEKEILDSKFPPSDFKGLESTFVAEDAKIEVQIRGQDAMIKMANIIVRYTEAKVGRPTAANPQEIAVLNRDQLELIQAVRDLNEHLTSLSGKYKEYLVRPDGMSALNKYGVAITIDPVAPLNGEVTGSGGPFALASVGSVMGSIADIGSMFAINTTIKGADITLDRTSLVPSLMQNFANDGFIVRDLDSNLLRLGLPQNPPRKGALNTPFEELTKKLDEIRELRFLAAIVESNNNRMNNKMAKAADSISTTIVPTPEVPTGTAPTAAMASSLKTAPSATELPDAVQQTGVDIAIREWQNARLDSLNNQFDGTLAILAAKDGNNKSNFVKLQEGVVLERYYSSQVLLLILDIKATGGNNRTDVGGWPTRKNKFSQNAGAIVTAELLTGGRYRGSKTFRVYLPYAADSALVESADQ